MQQKMSTEDQLRFALLEQSNTGILETLKRLENKIYRHFHWVIGSLLVSIILLLGTLGTLGTVIAKSLH